MIVRIILAGFSSVVSGVCYLSGLMRIMSGLLLGFGILAGLFFGIIFLLPANDDRLWFPIYGNGSSLPFFLVAASLAGLIGLLFFGRFTPADEEQATSSHYKYLGAGLLTYLCALFLPAFLWFPSDESRIASEVSILEMKVFAGVCLYLAGSALALFFLYRASRGTAPNHPDLMRRFVAALFSVCHLDKVPALVAYLLIFSPETHVIFPTSAALALAGYVPIGVFLIKVCADCRDSRQLSG